MTKKIYKKHQDEAFQVNYKNMLSFLVDDLMKNASTCHYRRICLSQKQEKNNKKKF